MKVFSLLALLAHIEAHLKNEADFVTYIKVLVRTNHTYIYQYLKSVCLMGIFKFNQQCQADL